MIVSDLGLRKPSSYADLGVLLSEADWWTMYEFDVAILEDETGRYVAFMPTLPSCHI